MTATRKAYRAAILHSIADPAEVGLQASHEYFEDGLLVIDQGRISAVGHAADLLPTLDADIEVVHHQDALITPGFIDTHIHFPQTGMIGSYGEQLLDWLNTYTFPCERQFADKAHADEVAKRFMRWPSGFSPNCCATAPPPPWCSAVCTPNRSMRCSSTPSAWTCA